MTEHYLDENCAVSVTQSPRREPSLSGSVRASSSPPVPPAAVCDVCDDGRPRADVADCLREISDKPTRLLEEKTNVC